jgi:hypothetical protein
VSRKSDFLTNLVAGARAGATPSDIYGTAWGNVLADVDSEALVVSGVPTISIPEVSSTYREVRRGPAQLIAARLSLDERLKPSRTWTNLRLPSI